MGNSSLSHTAIALQIHRPVAECSLPCVVLETLKDFGVAFSTPLDRCEELPINRIRETCPRISRCTLEHFDGV